MAPRGHARVGGRIGARRGRRWWWRGHRDRCLWGRDRLRSGRGRRFRLRLLRCGRLGTAVRWPLSVGMRWSRGGGRYHRLGRVARGGFARQTAVRVRRAAVPGTMPARGDLTGCLLLLDLRPGRPCRNRRPVDVLMQLRNVGDRAARNERPTLVEPDRDDRKTDRRGRPEQAERCGSCPLQHAVAEQTAPGAAHELSELVMHRYVNRRPRPIDKGRGNKTPKSIRRFVEVSACARPSPGSSRHCRPGSRPCPRRSRPSRPDRFSAPERRDWRVSPGSPASGGRRGCPPRPR